MHRLCIPLEITICNIADCLHAQRIQICNIHRLCIPLEISICNIADCLHAQKIQICNKQIVCMPPSHILQHAAGLHLHKIERLQHFCCRIELHSSQVTG